MNWRSPRLFLSLLFVIALLIVGIVLVIVYIHNTASQVAIVWQSSTTSFTKQEQQDIQTALKSALVVSNSDRFAGHEFTIIDAQRRGDWADFSANERVNHTTQPIATEPLFFLAHMQGTTWNIWFPGSSGFCNKLRQTPDTLLDSTDKQYFRGCYQ